LLSKKIKTFLIAIVFSFSLFSTVLHNKLDFIASEVDAIKDDLGNAGSRRQANKFIALALKSRAILV
jgi:hypothetical protein